MFFNCWRQYFHFCPSVQPHQLLSKFYAPTHIKIRFSLMHVERTLAHKHTTTAIATFKTIFPPFWDKNSFSL